MVVVEGKEGKQTAFSLADVVSLIDMIRPRHRNRLHLFHHMADNCLWLFNGKKDI